MLFSKMLLSCGSLRGIAFPPVIISPNRGIRVMFYFIFFYRSGMESRYHIFF
jgi:hypothetical protein